MGVVLNPYLNFRESAREAMTFYQSVFGGELTTMTFFEAGVPHDPADARSVMHSQLTTPNGLVLMGADTPSNVPFDGGGSISVSLSGDDEQTLRGYWRLLIDGADVHMSLEKAPWGDTFGMCTDRYGVTWLVNITGSDDAE